MKPRSKFKPGLQNKNAIPSKWSILRGDNVAVIGGPVNARGERGIVKEVIRDKGRVIIEGVNMRER
jgi:ribosomal protein L24